MTKGTQSKTKEKGATKETSDLISEEKDIVIKVNKEIVEERRKPSFSIDKASLDSWKPKTETGNKVKSGEIKRISEILDSGKKIMETEIVDSLVPELETELLLIGQSKGKFGGGQRRVFKQTQKKTMEGNTPKFSTCAVVGNKNGIVGMGFGKAKETIPAREKAFKNAKLNIIKIRRGCGSWECNCKTPHSVPFAVEAKCGSVIVRILPAPKGKGLCVQKECKKVLALSGIKDAYSKTYGSTKSRVNLINACFDALKQLMAMKTQPRDVDFVGITEGEIGETNKITGEPQNDQ